MNWEVFIPQAALVLIALIGGWFTLKGKKVDTDQASIQSLQKQITDMNRDRAAERAALQAEIDALKARERVRDDYIFVLRRGLSDSSEPVPPWPKELTGDHA